MRRFYAVACVLGVVLPYWQFVPWVAEHGLDSMLLIREIAQSRIAAFAWLDVFVSAVVLIRFASVESRRLGDHRLFWWPLLGTLTVGVSFGLPLFLFLRERYTGAQREGVELATQTH